MSFLCDFLILFFKLYHVILQFYDLLLFRIIDTFHLNYPVFENFIRFLQLLDSCLKAEDNIIFLN